MPVRHRLLEETRRLREALKVARKGEQRADKFESDLAKSEVRGAGIRLCYICYLCAWNKVFWFFHVANP